ncbi:hypothetical protein [Klebsiella pneumoniae]|uniref:hypothetical protein n=1 Tax=Klebsiella pneumoniae TaxID=573 RepID=UPI0020B15E0B|nr:hypothetical protein [Klebsiella pneumoniae]
MATQSEYELEAQLVEQLVGMHYERVNVTDETSMKANLRKQIEIHNRLESSPLTDGEFNRIFLHLTKGNEVIDRAKICAIATSYCVMTAPRSGSALSIKRSGARTSFR